jgi:hypothetical protein
MKNKNSLLLNTSRYVQGGVSETQNVRIEWWERSVFAKDPSDRVYVVEPIYEGRLDNISNAFYGDPRYWWVLAQFNNILDPASEVVAGRALLIPTKDRLSLMLTGRQGGVASTRTEVPSIPPVII